MLRTQGICFSVRQKASPIVSRSSAQLTRRHADIVDHYEPVMLIVGSRGLGNLKGYVPSFSWAFSHPHLIIPTASYSARPRTISSRNAPCLSWSPVAASNAPHGAPHTSRRIARACRSRRPPSTVSRPRSTRMSRRCGARLRATTSGGVEMEVATQTSRTMSRRRLRARPARRRPTARTRLERRSEVGSRWGGGEGLKGMVRVR